MYNIPFTTPQGWKCPICKRVYAPFVSECAHCGQQSITTSPTSEPTFPNVIPYPFPNISQPNWADPYRWGTGSATTKASPLLGRRWIVT